MKRRGIIRLSHLRIVLIAACLVAVGHTAQAVQWGGMKADKILFLGNSITFSGSNAAIGWPGNWGMAATAQSKDYVHILTTAINATTGGSLTVSPAGSGGAQNIASIANIFERNFYTYTNSQIQTQIDYGADIVVLQFADNMGSLDTDAAKAVFKSKLETMMNGLRASSNPHIFVTGKILWPDPVTDAIKQQVCAEDPTHRIFVDTNAFCTDPTNRGSSEGVFSDPGVASHPGDKGMQFIADTLYSAMESHAAAPEPASGALIISGLCCCGWRYRARVAAFSKHCSTLFHRR
jgi:hypothetical protein